MKILSRNLLENTENFVREDPPIKIWMGNITKYSCDAIVNAANSSLLGGGGVDGAIHRAAGPELLQECRTLHGCQTGQAKITNGYSLPCRYVIHTVGPVWNGGIHGEEEKLKSCYRTSLFLALEYGCKTVAFPAISTGVYRFPLELATAIACRTVLDFQDQYKNILKVIFVCFDAHTYETYRDFLRNNRIDFAEEK